MAILILQLLCVFFLCFFFLVLQPIGFKHKKSETRNSFRTNINQKLELSKTKKKTAATISSHTRNQKTRNQESGIRNQESGIRNQESTISNKQSAISNQQIRIRNQNGSSINQQPENHVTGVQPVVVSAIPTIKFNREAFSSIEDAQCSICLAEYQEKEVLRIMPKCGHNFHLACIDVWLRKQSTCPVCRLPLQQPCGTRHNTRQVAVSMVPPLDDSQISNDQFRQWLVPGSERTVSNISNQGHLEIHSESPPGNNSEPTQSRETETRQ